MADTTTDIGDGSACGEYMKHSEVVFPVLPGGGDPIGADEVRKLFPPALGIAGWHGVSSRHAVCQLQKISDDERL